LLRCVRQIPCRLKIMACLYFPMQPPIDTTFSCFYAAAPHVLYNMKAAICGEPPTLACRPAADSGAGPEGHEADVPGRQTSSIEYEVLVTCRLLVLLE
jgi:hypothetical protein